MEGMRGLWREFANAAAAASHFRKSSCQGFRLVSRRDMEFHPRPKRIFHLARIIYTHALATSQNFPWMFHAEINVPRLHLLKMKLLVLRILLNVALWNHSRSKNRCYLFPWNLFLTQMSMWNIFVCDLKASRFRSI